MSVFLLLLATVLRVLRSLDIVQTGALVLSAIEASRKPGKTDLTFCGVNFCGCGLAALSG